jgi:hypothetical protein
MRPASDEQKKTGHSTWTPTCPSYTENVKWLTGNGHFDYHGVPAGFARPARLSADDHRRLKEAELGVPCSDR